MSSSVDWYRLKIRLLTPYAWLMSRAMRSADPWARAALEAHFYRPSVFRFFIALWRRPTLLHEGPVSADGVVIDAGAFTGEWTASMRARHDARVVAFEPGPDAAVALRERFAPDPRVVVHGCGIGGSTRNVELSCLFQGSTAFGARVQDVLGTVAAQATTVALRDVVEVMDSLGPGDVDVLKLNIEGGEYEVLDRLIDTGYVRRVRVLVIQFHEWFESAYERRRRIRARLGHTHVEDWNYPFLWERWSIRPERARPGAAR